jgi:hypothetical protein
MSEWEETAARLREQADRDYPQAWIPEAEGDELVGVVAGVKPAVQTTYGPVPVVEVEDGLHAGWSVWLTHTVLRREFERQRPVLGETILIRYLGRVTPDGGGPAYESYRLVVDRPDQNSDVNWTAIADRYDGAATVPPPASQPAADAPPPHSDDDVPF